MSLLGIQQDYGGFDPKFVGVSIKISNSDTLQVLFSPEEQDSTSILNKPSSKAFETLSIATVLEHETRHFHDFLITPYSNYIFRYRIQALLNGFQFLFLSEKLYQDCNCIPIPISKWCKKNYQERQKLQKLWNTLDLLPKEQIVKLPELPYLNDNWNFWRLGQNIDLGFAKAEPATFDNLLKSTIAGYEKIKELVEGYLPNSSFLPCHVFEISAILVHIQAIWNSFGGDCTQLFFDKFKSAKTPYSNILELLMNLWLDEGYLINLDGISAIVIWSLLGDYETDQWKACPTYRLVQVYDLLRNVGVPSMSQSLMNLFDEWSERLGLSRVSNALNNNLNTNKVIKQIQYFYEEADKLNEAGIFSFNAKDIVKLMQEVTDANKYMTELFLKEPESYVYPNLYLENSHKFVNPLVKLDIKDGVLVGSEEFFKDNGFKIYFAKRVDNKRIGVESASIPINISNVRIINPELSNDLYLKMLILDYYFSEFNRDEKDFKYIRQIKKFQIYPNLSTLEVLA